MITSFAEDVVPVLVSTRAKRIENAKQFLKDNLIEIIACAARIYDLIEITLYSSINRQKKENEDQKKRHESNNKILQQHEVDALYKLIKSLLMNDISSTHNLLFEVICFLKSKEESNLLTRRWFSTWWKNNDLHRIKIKSITIVRYFAAQESDVKQWFVNYRNILQELHIIRSRHVWNFDEADFRVNCMQKKNILMFKDISDFYSINSENRKSLIIIEEINVADHKLISFVLIIQKQRLMQNWVQLELFAETLIKTFENEFTNDEIIIVWLKHFILHTNSNTNSLQKWKLLLMNQHDNHYIFEFVRFANDHHIRSFSFIFHFTHCMQSLNVEIFHSYKKHHDNIIKQVVAKFHLEYSLKRFCDDLSQIREHTFKEIIIRFAFEKFDMWSVNSQRCIDQLKKFAASNMKKFEFVRMLHDQLMSDDSSSNDLSLSKRFRIESQSCQDVNENLREWISRIRNINRTQWSDFIRANKFVEFAASTKRVMTQSHLTKFELDIHQKRRLDDLLQKITSRKRLHESNVKELTKENAEQTIAKKQQKETKTKRRKEYNNMMRIWRMKRDEMHAKEIIARKNEKARIKQIKKMKKQSVFISTKLMTLIANSEAKWKSSNEMWNAKQEKKKIKKRDDDDDDVQFIVNTMNDSNLWLQMNEQADYMTFDLRDENHFEKHFEHDEDDYFN